jgi:hypothetical protein
LYYMNWTWLTCLRIPFITCIVFARYFHMIWITIQYKIRYSLYYVNSYKDFACILITCIARNVLVFHDLYFLVFIWYDFVLFDKVPSDETLNKMKNLLELYASDTTELIAKYYWHRIREQR